MMAWVQRFRRQPWWKAAISDVQADVAFLRNQSGLVDSKLDRVLRELRIMGAREEQAWARQAELIQSVKDGYASLVAERDQYKAALENADADKAAAVAAALDADSDVDAAKVEAGNAALEELMGGSPEPTPEPETPVEPAPEPEAPADEPQA